MVVSAKFNDDLSYKNTDYAKIGGLKAEELKILEREFLKLIDYELRVTPLTFKNAHNEIKQLYRTTKYNRSRYQNQSMKVLTTLKTEHKSKIVSNEIQMIQRSESVNSFASTMMTHSSSYQELVVTDD